MTERQLPGLSKYLFCSDGEVISLWTGKPTILRGGVDKDGYRKFVLIDDMGARRYVRRASLICSAFHGPRPKGKEVRHLDGSRDNDAPDNLAWATHKENCGDKIEHGTAQRGDSNGNARLTHKQAVEVKAMLADGMATAKIATTIGVQKSTIDNIKYGKTWAWL